MDLLMDLSSPPAATSSGGAAVDPFAALEGLSLGEPSHPTYLTYPAAAAIDLTSLYGGLPPVRTLNKTLAELAG
jgi:hypothetical protein